MNSKERFNAIMHFQEFDCMLNMEFGPDFLFPILGEGAVDWHSFFEALDYTGYDGVFSIQLESFKYMYEVLGNDPVAGARLSMNSLQKLLSRTEG